MILKILNSVKDKSYIKEKYKRILRLEAKRHAQLKSEDISIVLEQLLKQIENTKQLFEDEKGLQQMLNKIGIEIKKDFKNIGVHSQLKSSSILEIINR